MAKRTAYKRDLDNGVKRIMVRLTRAERAMVGTSRSRWGSYAPTLSAMIRRGLVLACEEMNKETVK